jgi:hypothetical protein
MTNRDRIEFYAGDSLIASVASSMVPPIKAKISIAKKVFEVIRVTYALDHTNEPAERGMRANVDLRAV